jgi:acyl-coenzyme A synthetase/AMP-(fatty) acid ligase
MNFVQLVYDQAINAPNSKALINHQGFVTYAQLIKMVRQAARQLMQFPVGTEIGLLMADTPALTAIRLAGMQVGVVTVPLNIRFPKQEIDFRAGLFGLDTLVVDDNYEELTAGYKTIQIDFAGDECNEYRTTPVATVAWSGGTTGTASGIYITHKALIENLKPKFFWPTDGLNRVVGIVAPQYSGLGTGLGMTTLRSGGALVLEDRPFSPGLVAKNISTYGVDVIFATAPVFSMLLKRDFLQPEHVPGICYTTGDPTPDSLYKKWKEKFNVRLLNFYGATQTLGIAVHDEHSPNSSIGKLFDTIEIKLLDSNGNEVEPGQPGQAWFRGPSCALKSASPFESTTIDNEWITTDDMLVCKDGIYYLLGRKNDVFRVNNHFVSPMEIEEKIRDIDGVVDVVAVPDFDNNNVCRVKVCVEPTADADLEKVKKSIMSLNSVFKTWERPKLIEFIKEVPRHPGSMKIQRTKLNPLFNYNK